MPASLCVRSRKHVKNTRKTFQIFFMQNTKPIKFNTNVYVTAFPKRLQSLFLPFSGYFFYLSSFCFFHSHPLYGPERQNYMVLPFNRLNDFNEMNQDISHQICSNELNPCSTYVPFFTFILFSLLLRLNAVIFSIWAWIRAP